MPLIDAYPELHANVCKLIKQQRDADMAWHNEQKALITKAAVAEVASSLLKYTHDHNCVSDLDYALHELEAIKEVGKLKEGGEQRPNSESCYDAIEALKAFIAHIRAGGK
jgi:hypothetical protein